MQVLAKLDRLIRTYSIRRGADRMEGSYVSNADHIVIGGCGRSGTTLVRLIVDSHPRICCGPETSVFRSRVLDLQQLEHRFKESAQPIDSAYYASRCRAEFVDRLAAICCSATGKARWAEKTPRSVLNLPWILERFPNSKFVHVLRDGRDVACSLRTHPQHRLVKGRLVPTNTWKPMKYCAKHGSTR